MIVYCDLDKTLSRDNTMKLQVLELTFLSRCTLFFRSRGSKWRLKLLLSKKTDNTEFKPAWNEDVVSKLRQEKLLGNQIVLATAAESCFARKLVSELEIFDRIIGTEKGIHNKGRNKARRIIEDSSGQEFTYIGDSLADFQIWKHSNISISVNQSRLIKNISTLINIDLEYLEEN